jgi:uncharacterized protein YybS (DUF2232 family)
MPKPLPDLFGLEEDQLPAALPPKSNSPTRAIVETAFLASVTATIFLINTYFPLGPLLRMFYPIPVALVYLRWHSKAAWKAMLVTALLLTVLMGPLRSLQYVMPFGVMGVMHGYLWSRRVSWSISLALGTGLSTIGTAFQLALLSTMVGENLWVYFTVQITGLLGWIWQLFGSLDQPSLWVVQVMAIASMVFSNFMYQVLVHLVALLLLERIGNPITPAPKWLEDLIY